MSWTEFVMRSIGFNRVRKYETALARRVAYESHKGQYIFSKKRPPSIEKFWPLEGKKKGGVSKEHRAGFMAADAIYQAELLKQKNGTIKRTVKGRD